MNAQLREIEDRHRRRFEEDLSGRLDALFRRCPALYGFVIQEEAAVPSHVTYHPAQNQEDAEAMLGEVAQMLLELVEERPEGAALLHGRTFARIVH